MSRNTLNLNLTVLHIQCSVVLTYRDVQFTAWTGAVKIYIRVTSMRVGPTLYIYAVQYSYLDVNRTGCKVLHLGHYSESVGLLFNLLQYRQCSAKQCSIVQCIAIKCSVVQHSSVQFSSVQCSTVRCSAGQCNTVQCIAAQLSTIQYSTVHYNAVQCTEHWEPYTQCNTVLYC